jgi:hypothetical protein
MESHKKILAILYIVHGIIQALGMLLLSVFIASLFPFILDQAEVEAHWILEWIGPFLGILSTSIIILFSIPSIIGGISLLNGKSWALTLLLVLGCFKLFSFPFGTALGIYTIWVYAEDKKTAPSR